MDGNDIFKMPREKNKTANLEFYILQNQYPLKIMMILMHFHIFVTGRYTWQDMLMGKVMSDGNVNLHRRKKSSKIYVTGLPEKEEKGEGAKKHVPIYNTWDFSSPDKK